MLDETTAVPSYRVTKAKLCAAFEMIAATACGCDT
jgi:hypothetical protein